MKLDHYYLFCCDNWWFIILVACLPTSSRGLKSIIDSSGCQWVSVIKTVNICYGNLYLSISFSPSLPLPIFSVTFFLSPSLSLSTHSLDLSLHHYPSLSHGYVILFCVCLFYSLSPSYFQSLSSQYFRSRAIISLLYFPGFHDFHPRQLSQL